MLPHFPEFTPLKLENKAYYEELISKYPPFSNISFAGLQIWWNLEGHLTVSSIHQNLIINYHLPFDKDNSGLSLIGNESLDHSIDEIFAYLRKEHQAVKLVHIPDFVVAKIKNKDAYIFEEELDYNEYIFDAQALATLEGPRQARTRTQINRFRREVENRKVEIKSLDLSSDTTRRELQEAILAWEEIHPPKNDPDHTEHQALQRTMSHAKLLGIQYLGLYVDGRLHGIVLYNKSQDTKYYTINHLRVDYSIPYIFDYMVHSLAKQGVEEGVDFLNMEMDLGIESLRKHKQWLQPVNFFRQYTVKPAKI